MDLVGYEPLQRQADGIKVFEQLLCGAGLPPGVRRAHEGACLKRFAASLEAVRAKRRLSTRNASANLPVFVRCSA